MPSAPQAGGARARAELTFSVCRSTRTSCSRCTSSLVSSGPSRAKNEVTEFVKSGLRDLSISRTSVKWGIPVPNDPKHVVYVWLDALTNYVSALGGPGSGAHRPAQPGAVGRVYPSHRQGHPALPRRVLAAFLMSAGLPRPRASSATATFTVKGQKISSPSRPRAWTPTRSPVRWGPIPCATSYCGEYSLGGDGDFTYEALFQRHESDLGNDLGNLVNRTVSMARTLGGDGLDAARRAGTRPAIRCPRRSWSCATSRARPPWPRPRRGTTSSPRVPWRQPGP